MERHVKNMANTYTQLYTHIVFTVKGRQNIIPKKYKEELHKYITGIIKGKNQKLIAINSMPDHVHILIGMNPNLSLSDYMPFYRRSYHSQTLILRSYTLLAGCF